MILQIQIEILFQLELKQEPPVIREGKTASQAKQLLKQLIAQAKHSKLLLTAFEQHFSLSQLHRLQNLMPVCV
ncbi:hypothetical protein I79_016373 [Cricetulus griseus]|uniref:Uncharacterized protein n=1 Tax=Cricetulus griseus TaxID=10029 RepID=G3HZ77_CRIGR|nr:hypothetical protein I79_016373 [Cricetulus griseus]